MVWILLAAVSAAISGVGFWRGTPSGLASQALPAAAGVLFCLVMFRASTLISDRKALGQKGGWPLLAAGALCLTATLAAGVDVARWIPTRAPTVGPYLLPVASLGLLMLAVGAMRLSLDSPRRTHFYVLALAAAANSVVAVVTFVQALNTP